LFETRALNFDHVIVLDVNEGTLPNLRMYEPLIPREVMVSLGLDRLELEEEIQRYQFLRLISSAQDVHLVYEENKEKERSRLIEELVWEEEKKKQAIGGIKPLLANFKVKINPPLKKAVKSAAIVDHLRGMKYSATSINMYIRNPMEFYQKYVLGLEE